MSFRSRFLSRNSQVTASFVPVFEFKVRTGSVGDVLPVPVCEHNPRLMKDFTTQHMLDSGLELPKFTQSPDTCVLFDTISKDMDLQCVSQEIQSLGYSLDEPLSKQNNKSHSDVIEVNKSVDTNASVDTNNTNTNISNNE